VEDGADGVDDGGQAVADGAQERFDESVVLMTGVWKVIFRMIGIRLPINGRFA
jgi:hypothetical protein